MKQDPGQYASLGDEARRFQRDYAEAAEAHDGAPLVVLVGERTRVQIARAQAWLGSKPSDVLMLTPTEHAMVSWGKRSEPS